MNKKYFFLEKLFWVIVLGAFFFITYGLANSYTAILNDVPYFFFSWENYIPFIDWMIVPYMSSDLLFVLAFFMCLSYDELRTFSKRIIFVTVISVICYYLFPLKCVFIRPEVENPVYKFLFELLSLDMPYNQCPSLHISYGVIIWLVIYPKLKQIFQYITHFWFILIAFSTLTVFQHHFIDIPFGFLLALYSIMIFNERRASNVEVLINSLSMLFLVLSFYIKSNFSYLLLYPAFSLLLVGVAYHFNLMTIFKKKNGTIPILNTIIFFPYLLSAKLNSIYQKRKFKESYAKIKTNLYMGRLPSDRDLHSMSFINNSIIIDLSAELNENKSLLKKSYHHFPILDLSTPKISYVHKILNTIEEELKKDPLKNIYIHCTLGLSRSALITSALLIRRGTSFDKSLELIRMNKKDLHLPLLYIELLKQVQESYSS